MHTIRMEQNGLNVSKDNSSNVTMAASCLLSSGDIKVTAGIEH